ncbi:ATP-binding protein [Herminiimonas sp. CN]|uniref:ATP-binding protein n=1 Tax=Herminiimonas sp. CN TaxID=1349818 RepID=UPI00047328D5|nr:ATP-binding protein [Herminiimonas sp. CN]
MKQLSLRQRLTLMIMASLVVVWSAMAVFSYRESREEISELFDARLEQGARIILLLDLKRLQRLVSNEGASEVIEDHDGDIDRQGKALPFQVWDANGQLLLHNASAPHIPFRAGSGLDTIQAQDKTWRTLALWNQKHGFQVRVFEDAQQRSHLAGGIMRRMLAPLLLGLPGLALLIWLSIGRGLRPLQSLSAAISARSANKLDLITLHSVPKEVQVLIASLNGLLQRLSHSMDQERRFTADAAHELRTPLAAIKVQAEVALAAQDRQQQGQALHGIIEGINRTTRLSEQLLMLARLDHLAPESQQTIDLGELARQSAARYADSALNKEIDLSVNAADTFRMRGDPVLLEALIGNLIDNAIRYTPPQGSIEIGIQTVGERISLSVRDDGPGLSEQDKERVLHRFYRADDSGTSGSGLGLSIVERIAQVHRATITLETGLHGTGLGVSILFPNGNISH